MHLVMIGGSDAGISAALRARELDPGAEVTVVVADAYPNFSICGIPYYISGEVTHWRNLAHRTNADLEATGMRLRLDTTARRIDVAGRKLLVTAADGDRGTAQLRQARRGHRRGPGPAADHRPGPARPRRGRAPAALDGRHVRADAHPGGSRARVRGDRRGRVYRPGNGRRAHHPGPAGHPDGAAARGAADRRPAARRACAHPAHRARRGSPHRHHGQADQPGRRRRRRAPAGGSHRGGRLPGHPRSRRGAGSRRGPPRHRARRRRRRRPRAPEAPSPWTAACAPACPMCSPPGTAWSPTTGCSARPTCRWAPPRTSRAGSPGRTPSAAPGNSPAASAPRSSRSSTRPPPAPGCATTKPPPAGFDPVTVELRSRRPQGLLPRQPPHHHAGHRGPRHRAAAGPAAVRPQERRDRQAHRHRRHRHLPRHDRRRLSDLDLSYTPPLGSPWEAVQMGAQTWLREASHH